MENWLLEGRGLNFFNVVIKYCWFGKICLYIYIFNENVILNIYGFNMVIWYLNIVLILFCFNLELYERVCLFFIFRNDGRKYINF